VKHDFCCQNSRPRCRPFATSGVGATRSDGGSQTIAGLKKAVDAPDEVVLAALGWLARENKLAFETNGRSVTVSLL
jgi:hypothetical protein